MTNRANGTLCVGVTSTLARRVWEHREGVVEEFADRYGLKRLVYVEGHAAIVGAIRRGKTIKRWVRAWTVRLIVERNPGWADLYDVMV